MSQKLDDLLRDLNDALAGRFESEVPLNDEYWRKRNEYQQALHAADGVHIPEGPDELSNLKKPPIEVPVPINPRPFIVPSTDEALSRIDQFLHDDGESDVDKQLRSIGIE